MIGLASVVLLSASTFANPTNPIVNAIVPSFCYKWTYGRGAGIVPSHCGDGDERNGALCYPKCREGYVGNGPVCWERCPENYVNDGAVCRKKGSLRLHWKKSHGRGWGRPMNCGDDNHAQSGLCYKDCRDGFEGVGPVCHQKCSGKYGTNCGAGCTKSGMDCASGLVGMAGAAGLATAAGIAWGPWNPVWPVVAGGWTAVTALTNGQCPDPDAEDKYPYTPATYVPSWTSTTAYTATYTGIYQETPVYSAPTPYLATVEAYTTPTDCTYGATEASYTPIETNYATPTLYTPPAYTPVATYGAMGAPAGSYSAPTDAYVEPTKTAYDAPESTSSPEGNALYSSAQSVAGLTSALLSAAIFFL
jgi:hypothetical protein